ncbi:MAG: glycosyltransferase [Cyanobacteria bacterium P01_C01_bin.72]
MAVSFSIVLTTSNPKYLPRALSSIARQTYTNYELLIVNNVSVREIDKIIASYQSIHQIEVIANQTESNIGALRNMAIAQASGNFIAFLDSDDEWRDDYLQVMYQALSDSPPAIFAYCYCQIFSLLTHQYQKVRALPQVGTNLTNAILKNNFIHTISSVVFRRHLFTRLGLFDEDFFCHPQEVDWEFFIRVFNVGKPVIVPYYLVRKGNDSLNSERQDLTLQQQEQFDRVRFTQQLIRKNLIQKKLNSLLEVKLKLHPKFCLSISQQSNFDNREISTNCVMQPLKSLKPLPEELVSLVVTVYNRETYIAATIDSILTQTYRDIELIIWDDGSTDGSLAIVKQYALKDQRIKVKSAENQGQGTALVKAIALCKGKYLGTVDSDDLLHPEAVERTLAKLKSDSDVGMVYTNHWVIDTEGKVKSLGKRSLIPYSPTRLLIDFMTFHFRLMRRDIYDAVGGFDPNLSSAEDYDLCLKFSEVTQIAHLSEPLYYYRWHDANLSRTQQLTQVKCSAIAVNRALVRRGLSQKLRLELQLNPSYRLQRQRKVANKVFGIGLSKTGTTSLNDALCLLGIPSIHLPHSLGQIEAFDGATDLSVAAAYQKLDLLYPGSKFILTIRKPSSWLRSSYLHKQKIERLHNGKISIWMKKLDEQFFGQWEFEPTAYLAAYERHLTSVLSYFKDRESDLLILNIFQGQGWFELCTFLGCDLPDINFPHKRGGVVNDPFITLDSLAIANLR